MSGSLTDRISRIFRTPIATTPENSYDSAIDVYQAQGPIELRSSVGGVVAPINLNKPIYPKRSVTTYSEQGYAKLALIFHCINLISHSASVASVRVYDEMNDDEEVPNHPARQLIRRPNPSMKESKFISFVVMNAAVTGFCVIEKVRSPIGRVVELNPLPSHRLRPILRDQAPPDWEYKLDGLGTYTLKAEDVLVFTYADRPDRDPYGLAPVEVILREIGLLNSLTDFLKILIDRGGVPLYGVIPDLMPSQRLSQLQIDDMTARFLERHGGLEKGAIPWIMQGIKDVKRLSFDMDELALTDIRDISDIAICQAFGIHPAFATTRVGLEHSDTRANSKEARKSFYEDVIIPLWTRLDDTFTLGLLPEFTDNENLFMGFDISEVQALQENVNDRAQWVTHLGETGLLSQHTVLASLGFDPPETPDFYLRPINLQAIPVEDPLGLGLVGPTGPAGPTGTTGPSGTTGPEDKSARTQREIRRHKGYETRSARAHVNRNLQIQIANRMQPQVQTFLHSQQQRVVREIKTRAAVGDRETRAKDDVDWDEEDKGLHNIVLQLWDSAGKTSWQAAGDQLNMSVDWKVSNPKVRSVMSRVGERVTGINDTTRTEIQKKVTSGIEKGLTYDQIAETLTPVFNSTRALVISRTEAQVSYNLASASAYAESGVVEQIQCFDNPDHTEDYGAEDGLSCAERDGFIDDLDSADLHVESEHPNGSLAIAPVIATDPDQPDAGTTDGEIPAPGDTGEESDPSLDHTERADIIEGTPDLDQDTRGTIEDDMVTLSSRLPLNAKGNLIEYGSTGYEMMNKLARGTLEVPVGFEVQAQFVQDKIDRIDGIFTSGDPHLMRDSDVVVYRGMVTPSQSGEPDWLQSLEPGSVIADKGFLSTSFSPEVAEKFAAPAGLNHMSEQAVTFKLLVPGAVPGLHDTDFFTHKDEDELLLQRNSKVLIHKVTREYGRVNIFGEIVP